MVGIIMAIYGYTCWYHLVQKPLDEKLNLELQKLRASKGGAEVEKI